LNILFEEIANFIGKKRKIYFGFKKEANNLVIAMEKKLLKGLTK
jgi:hypothetical protein